MARSPTKKPTDTGKKRTWARQEGEGLHQSNAQSKEEVESRKCEPKGPCIFHAARIKQLPERIVESDKHKGNGKWVKAKKVMDSDGSEAYTQDLGTTYLYPANTGEVGHGSRVWKVVVYRWGERGAYFGVPAQTSLERNVMLRWHLAQKK